MRPPRRSIQLASWLAFTLVVYSAVAIVTPEPAYGARWWLRPPFVAFVGMGIVDWLFCRVGRAVMEARRGKASRLPGSSARPYLASTWYLPTWLGEQLLPACLYMLFIFSGSPAALESMPSAALTALCVFAPALFRSQKFGLARFNEKGMRVIGDDGRRSNLAWSALPDIAFLRGDLSDTHDMPRLPPLARPSSSASTPTGPRGGEAALEGGALPPLRCRS